MNTFLQIIKKAIPKRLFNKLSPFYHYALAFWGAVLYRFPSRNLIVIGVTGTKGKTTTVELIGALLENEGYKTAFGSTYRFSIAGKRERNLFKMTMPGRFEMQRFLRRAADEGCTHVVIEMTSQGVLQFRHKWIDLDALVFTNISPEHIESHGSFENYLTAKLSLAHALEHSSKKEQRIIANNDDPYGKRFLSIHVPRKYPFSLEDVKPYTTSDDGISFTFEGRTMHSSLLGEFNLYNILAATITARAFSVSLKTIEKTLKEFRVIRGRLEEISVRDDQPFRVYVDYAHTADSLEKVYKTFSDARKVCVLGNAGGGRDTWKRSVMAETAEKHCDRIILTNEDPYDEDPKAIVEEMAHTMSDNAKCEIVMDRREAIKKAIEQARAGDVVLITGKGTDPYIMSKDGTKIPWDDAEVTRDVLKKHLERKS